MLNTKVLADLIRRADDLWFAKHLGSIDRQGHIEYVAGYIAKYYGRKEKDARENSRD